MPPFISSLHFQLDRISENQTSPSSTFTFNHRLQLHGLGMARALSFSRTTREGKQAFPDRIAPLVTNSHSQSISHRARLSAIIGDCLDGLRDSPRLQPSI